MTLEQAINWYVRRKQATGISFSKGYYLYRAFLRATGNLDLSRVNVNHVSQFLNRSRASTTVFRVKHSLLRHFFEYWAAHGEISESLMPANRPPERSTFLPYIYTREELHRMLRLVPTCITKNDKIHPKTLRAILLVLYATGASACEVTRLVCESVDLQNCIFKLPGSRGKTSRSIPLGKDLIRVVQQYADWRKRVETQGDRFFSRMDGGFISPRAVQRNFERLRRKAGIAGFRKSSQKPCVRDLRATFAVHQITSWIKKKEDLDVMLPALAAYIGNAGLESTERFLRLTPARFQDALNKLSPSRLHARWQDDSRLLKFLTEL
ncbi:MAG TPA: tyrosine-type recombinase/integrase [Terracidiphilus sp.]|nr:tyrosine-type recombinase/integrase [Terracidiphilus sp.]